MRHLTQALLLALLVLLAPLGAGELISLSKIDRRLTQEPSYAAQVRLYGLVVFGPEAKTRVWMVLDKSEPGVDVYDVLYADLNGDGDLTQASERFVADSANTLTSQFRLPDFTDTDTGITHTDFSLRAKRGSQPIFMISVMWRGELKFGGGYAPDPEYGYMRFASAPEQAPIVWINGDGPFRFQRWYSGELRIGSADDFKVFLGQQGVGEHSFASFQCHALPPDEPVLATLIYQDTDGAEHHLDYKLKERC